MTGQAWAATWVSITECRKDIADEARRLEAAKYPVAPARRAAEPEPAAARKSPRVAGSTAGPGVGDSEGM